MKYTVNNNVEKDFIINKSKFIVCIRHINNSEDFTKYLDDIKGKYPNATHYCYAYIIDSYEKYSDDREPSGTAGFPILNVLKKNNLNKILCIVVRYFGGIKLGVGGLLRAYSSTVSDTIKDLNLVEDINYNFITIEFGYDRIKDVEFILKNYEITNKSFNEFIKFEIKVPNSKTDELLYSLKNLNVKIK